MATLLGVWAELAWPGHCACLTVPQRHGCQLLLPLYLQHPLFLGYYSYSARNLILSPYAQPATSDEETQHACHQRSELRASDTHQLAGSRGKAAEGKSDK